MMQDPPAAPLKTPIPSHSEHEHLPIRALPLPQLPFKPPFPNSSQSVSLSRKPFVANFDLVHPPDKLGLIRFSRWPVRHRLSSSCRDLFIVCCLLLGVAALVLSMYVEIRLKRFLSEETLYYGNGTVSMKRLEMSTLTIDGSSSRIQLFAGRTTAFPVNVAKLDGGLETKGWLNFSRDAQVSLLNIGQTMVVRGQTFAANVDVRGPVNIVGKLISSGPVAINGSIYVQGNATYHGHFEVTQRVLLIGNTTVNGDLIIQGNTTASRVFINGTLTQLAPAVVDGSVMVGGSSTANVSTWTIGGLTVNKSLEVNISSKNSLRVSGALPGNINNSILAVANSVSVQPNRTVMNVPSGQFNISGGSLTAVEGLSVDGTVNVSNSFSHNGYLHVAGDAVLLSSAALDGHVTVNGTMTVGSLSVQSRLQLSGNMHVIGTASLNASLTTPVLTVNDNVTVAGAYSCGRRFVSGAMIVQTGRFLVASIDTVSWSHIGALFLGSLRVNGTTKASSFLNSADAVFSNMTVLGSAWGYSDILVSNNTSVLGDVYVSTMAINGNATVAGNMFVGGGATVETSLDVAGLISLLSGTVNVSAVRSANAAWTTFAVSDTLIFLDGRLSGGQLMVSRNSSRFATNAPIHVTQGASMSFETIDANPAKLSTSGPTFLSARDLNATASMNIGSWFEASGTIRGTSISQLSSILRISDTLRFLGSTFAVAGRLAVNAMEASMATCNVTGFVRSSLWTVSQNVVIGGKASSDMLVVGSSIIVANVSLQGGLNITESAFVNGSMTVTGFGPVTTDALAISRNASIAGTVRVAGIMRTSSILTENLFVTNQLTIQGAVVFHNPLSASGTATVGTDSQLIVYNNASLLGANTFVTGFNASGPLSSSGAVNIAGKLSVDRTGSSVSVMDTVSFSSLVEIDLQAASTFTVLAGANPVQFNAGSTYRRAVSVTNAGTMTVGGIATFYGSFTGSASSAFSIPTVTASAAVSASGSSAIATADAYGPTLFSSSSSASFTSLTVQGLSSWNGKLTIGTTASFSSVAVSGTSIFKQVISFENAVDVLGAFHSVDNYRAFYIQSLSFIENLYLASSGTSIYCNDPCYFSPTSGAVPSYRAQVQVGGVSYSLLLLS